MNTSKFALTRRNFMKVTGASALALSLQSLGVEGSKSEATSKVISEWDYGTWEDIHREEWVWDKVTFGTHLVDCYPGNCSWHVYTKEGIVWREEQSAQYAVVDATGPDWNPRGCQKGCTYSHMMYNADRLKYPMKRIGERGEGKWQRLSWDDAATMFADGMLDAIEAEGPESIIHEMGPGNGGFLHLIGLARIAGMLGATSLDLDATIGDFNKGIYETFGKFQFMDSCDGWFFGKLILIWHMNPVYTRIPSAHFISEARYNGAEVITIAPDFSPSAVHADEFVPVIPGTDAALALGMAQVLIDENLIDEPFVKGQTDFPFLVRSDNGRFLREPDVTGGGREDQMYFYDSDAKAIVKAPRGTLELSVDPAMEGTYTVDLHDGSTVEVRPSFAIFKEMLNRDYTPELASKICSVHPDTIRSIARKAGAAEGRVQVMLGYNTPKYYHGDLMERAMCLIVALTGSLGKKGSGVRGWNTSGMNVSIESASGFSEATSKSRAAEIRVEDPEITEEILLRQLAYEMERKGNGSVPPAFLYYFHSGYKEAWDNAAWHDPGMKRTFAEYFQEAIDKGWWEGRVRPAADQEPQAYFYHGTSPARKNRGWIKNIYPTLWKKYKFICGVDVRMSTTCLYSDLVLPAAGFYEKLDVRFPTPHVPWLTLTEKAVEPPEDAMEEWDMAELLVARLVERAKERGLTKFQARSGRQYDLARGAGFGSTATAEQVMDLILKSNARAGVLPAEANLEHFRKVGILRFTRIPSEASISSANLATEIKPDEPIVPLTLHTGPKKIPYPTYARRIQFYVDHEWFLESGEGHPVHKDNPKIGGDYPLTMTSGHQRWSVHSIWVTDTRLLRTHQGRPFMFMNPDDARERGIKDGDLARVHNDFNDFKIHVKITPSARPRGQGSPGQVIIYHAWEPYQFEGWKSYDAAIPGMIKWNDLAGGYGHLEHYNYNWCTQPVDRAVAVEVEKA